MKEKWIGITLNSESHIFALGNGILTGNCENILIETDIGACVHVDFDCLFNKGLQLDTPEIVPFRLTPNLVSACGITGVDGVFKQSCQACLRICRLSTSTLTSVLHTFLYDPLVEWKLSQCQTRTSISTTNNKAEDGKLNSLFDLVSQKQLNINQQIQDSTAAQKLNDITKRLIGQHEKDRLSVEGQVQKLIKQATSEWYLGQMYIGWMPWM